MACHPPFIGLNSVWVNSNDLIHLFPSDNWKLWDQILLADGTLEIDDLFFIRIWICYYEFIGLWFHAPIVCLFEPVSFTYL
jgi:hypothetical protein